MQCGQRRYRLGRGCRPASPSYCAPRLPPKESSKFETSPSSDRTARWCSGSHPTRCTTKRPSRRRSHKVPSSRHQAKATRSHCRCSDQIGRDARAHSLCTRSRHRWCPRLRIELADIPLEARREPDVSNLIGGQSMRTRVGRLRPIFFGAPRKISPYGVMTGVRVRSTVDRSIRRPGPRP
jgi:hypothetical protein